jgi:hypothetical protein
MRSTSCALLLIGAFASAPFGALAGAPSAGGPWLDPANADHYVFVGKDVWDAATGKLIAPGAAPILYQNSRAVVGATDRLWMPPTGLGLPGMPEEGMLYSTTDNYQRVHPTLDGKPWSNLGDFPGFWIASDLRRAVWIDKGDFWRGVVDWNKHRVVDPKQVTHVGVFTGKSPLLWSGELLFVNGGFDPKKPVVRIDLNSGATEEMETYHVFNVGESSYADATVAAGMVSPSACCLINPTAEPIYTYDVRTGKAGTIHNPLFDKPGATPVAGLVDNTHPPVWLDDETVVFVNTLVAKLDLRKQEMQILFSFDSAGDPGVSWSEHVLPGNRHLDIEGSTHETGTGVSNNPKPIFKQRFLIDLVTGQKIPTTLDEQAHSGMWLNDSKFMYVRTTGGLSSVGTWLYDRHTNASVRIAPAQLEMTRARLLRNGAEVWAVNTARGTTLTRAKVDGSGSEELGPSQMFQPTQFPSGPPLDLGLTGPSSLSSAAAAAPIAPVADTPVAPKPPASAAVEPTTTAVGSAAQTPYAFCWGGLSGPTQIAYFGVPFEASVRNVPAWSAAYKEFLRGKYKFAGVIHCGTLKSLAEAQQRIHQEQDAMRAHWQIVETGWKYE